MSNTNTEIVTTAYEKLQKALTQSNTVLPKLEEAVEKGNLDNYATVSQLEEKANKADIANGLTAKGNVSYSNLPTSGNKIGDYYYCSDGISGSGNYVWNGSTWYFGGTGDEGYNLLKNDIDDFVNVALQFDDITMLCLEYKKKR